MTCAEFKRLDIYKNMKIIRIVNEKGASLDYVSEEELNKREVVGYFIKNDSLTLELGESLEDFL